MTIVQWGLSLVLLIHMDILDTKYKFASSPEKLSTIVFMKSNVWELSLVLWILENVQNKFDNFFM